MSNSGDATVINDRYEIHKRVGRGGMADVFFARDLLLDRQVAIKILFPEFAVDPNFVERFRREAQAAANLSHPNIVNVYDWGKYEGTYFIAMEYVQGRTLAEILKTNKQLTPEAGGRDRQRGGRGARIRPRGRARPPRHQAGQHPDRVERSGEGGRLRHRPGDELGHRVQPHAGRFGDGHRVVLLARAGPGRPTRPAQRPVLARHRDVRDGRRQAAVHRREPGGDRLQAGARPADAAQQARRRRCRVRSRRSSPSCSPRTPSCATRAPTPYATTCAGSATASRCRHWLPQQPDPACPRPGHRSEHHPAGRHHAHDRATAAGAGPPTAHPPIAGAPTAAMPSQPGPDLSGYPPGASAEARYYQDSNSRTGWYALAAFIALWHWSPAACCCTRASPRRAPPARPRSPWPTTPTSRSIRSPARSTRSACRMWSFPRRTPGSPEEFVHRTVPAAGTVVPEGAVIELYVNPTEGARRGAQRRGPHPRGRRVDPGPAGLQLTSRNASSATSPKGW